MQSNHYTILPLPSYHIFLVNVFPLLETIIYILLKSMKITPFFHSFFIPNWWPWFFISHKKIKFSGDNSLIFPSSNLPAFIISIHIPRFLIEQVKYPYSNRAAKTSLSERELTFIPSCLLRNLALTFHLLSFWCHSYWLMW